MLYILYFLIAALICGGIVLSAFSSTITTLAVCLVMVVVMVIGTVIYMVPVLSYTKAFQTGIIRISEANQTEVPMEAMLNNADAFGNKFLNKTFQNYAEEIKYQQANNLILSDISEYINEQLFVSKTFANVAEEFANTLTGLGLLGTFIGIIQGIRNLGFTSVTAAITSINELFEGIDTAFYTSLIGLGLALVYRLIHLTVWEALMSNLTSFTMDFHNFIIPTPERQLQYIQQRNKEYEFSLLERLPQQKDYTGFGAKTEDVQSLVDTEEILMPQVTEAMEAGDFSVAYKPRYNLFTRALSGAEAIVQWTHEKFGLIPASRYLPLLEHNGYITRLDSFIWEESVKTVAEMEHPVPVTLQVTKTDIMAMNVAKTMTALCEKYHIPPTLIDIKIPESVYIGASEIIFETEDALKQAGFRVILGGFDGNFLAFPELSKIKANVFQINLSICQNIQETCHKAKTMHIKIMAEHIDSIKDITQLKQLSCEEGQGRYFADYVTKDELLSSTGRKAES